MAVLLLWLFHSSLPNFTLQFSRNHSSLLLLLLLLVLFPSENGSLAPRRQLPWNIMNRKFKEFPYASVPHRELMVELVSTVENRLGETLLPCTLPSHVQYFENESATAHASLYVRSENSSSQVDFIPGSWVHCNLPTGGVLNITSLSAY